MKKLIAGSLLAASLSLGAFAGEKTETIKVSGWHCGGCAARTESALKDVKGVEALVRSGHDPLHAAYVAAQNFTSFFAESVSQFPEFDPYCKIVGPAQDEYMPSGPPMSPLTLSYFTTWAFFDVRFGPDGETIGTCLLDLAELLVMDPFMVETIRRLRAALEMNPTFPLAHFWLGRIYTMRGQYGQALDELDAVDPALRQWQPAMAAKGYLFGVWGKREEARTVLDDFQALRQSGHFTTSYGVALVYTALGDKEEAFAWLDRAFEERSHWLVWLALDPRWDRLRADARFGDLLRRVGLADKAGEPNQEGQGDM